MTFVDNSAKTNWKFIGIVALLAVLVGGGVLGYLFVIKQENGKSIESLLITRSTPKEKIDTELANWVPYRNEEYGFEIQFPSDLLFRLERSVVVLQSFSTSKRGSSSVYDLILEVGKIKVSALEDAQSKLADLPESYVRVGPYNEEVGGDEIYITVHKLDRDDRRVTKSYYFPEFILAFAYANSSVEIELTELERQILSTFRYIEPEDLADASWRSYRSPKMKFSLEYPAVWVVVPERLYYREGSTLGYTQGTKINFRSIDGDAIFSVTEGAVIYSQEKGRNLAWEEILDGERRHMSGGYFIGEAEIKLDGYSATSISYIASAARVKLLTKIIAIYEKEHNTWLHLTIDITDGNESKEEQFSSILQQILSTFRFIE